MSCFGQAWLGEIHEYAQDDVVIMLLGNKADCTTDRVIRPEDGERLAKVCTTDRVLRPKDRERLAKVCPANRVIRPEDGELLAKVCTVDHVILSEDGSY